MIFVQIKNALIKYFKTWWLPIAFYVIPIGLYMLGSILKRDFLIDAFLFTIYLNIAGNIISSIVQIVIGKWYFLFPQLIISFFLFLWLGLFFLFSPPDFYGAHKVIPNDIEISKPLDSIPEDKEFEKNNLVLSCLSQPGIYNFYINAKPKELGHFYIKAFEITSNDRLSEDRIKNRSDIKVENLEPKLYSGEFTIYEGSWGDKYAARIELWFIPQNKKEYKIAERNYIVEGWMR
ncbi:hypothetical protein HNP37_003049 [Flavobacterium nitrogenifigens]|uniref:Uncharacterized protein n=2 Tax=Flavobacterium TaxID=237 RepID=A0A7W7IYK5_9FLAO|nr:MULTISPECIES: hypothetical protein [Flavobacterium]MBB4802974.1 hypothetical protein [Flavobacterium nitrogenifigens]MBB6387932.1 hypothetical protein [Flavobacterium notoginsengisoli]